MAQVLNNLANLYTELGQYAKAEPLYRRSLEIKEAKLGKDHPHVADSLNNLAILYHRLGQYAKAEPLYCRSLEIYEAKLGKDHPFVADALHELATLYQQLGQLEKAEPLYRRSLEIREARLGRDHPDMASSLNNLALFEAGQQHWDEASRLFERERRGVCRHIARALPSLSPAEQLGFLTSRDASHFHVALSLGWEKRGDPTARLLSVGWLLNGKGVSQDALAAQALLERDTTNPGRRKIVRNLQGVRQQRASLALAVPRSGQEQERQRRLEELADQQRDLERHLAQAGGHGDDREDPWIDLAEVRKTIPADAILIDIARFRVANFKAKAHEKFWEPARYAAWVVPPAGEDDVQLIDLGDAEAIDQTVRDVRQALAASPTAIRGDGEAAAEQALRRPLAALAQKLLQPLRPHLDGKRQWLLSPDAALWLVPWAALPLDDEHYVIERHTIRYLISGRDLVRPEPKRPGGAEPPRIVADPDFDLAPAAARAQLKELLPGAEPAAELRGLSLLPSGGLPRVGRLPFTAAEAEAIGPLVEKYAGAAPRVYRGEQAQEAVVKAFRTPRVLVLATHAFFLEDQEAADTGRFGLAEERPHVALTKEGKPLENPLLRCGLLLAGCNDRSERPAGDDDGVLTGLEVVGIDLRGTELVVLSACQTGVGTVNTGEGVAGLRQAFQLAGARAVLATLWQVHDKETMLLMTKFFAELARGRDKAEALRQAQLERIQRRRDRYGAAHPFYWAAFTLTGQ